MPVYRLEYIFRSASEADKVAALAEFGQHVSFYPPHGPM
jgi:hypothetical protein